MDVAKIRLSQEEAALVQNAHWILTKNEILIKVNELLASLQDLQVENWRSQLNSLSFEMPELPPRISRGEKFNGLPWMMLDYPRVFGKSDVLAIRTMFWWGNYFSCTLHLAGAYKDRFEQQIIERLSTSEAELYISVSDDQWQHAITSPHYVSIRNLGAEEIRNLYIAKGHAKIAAKVPLDNWENAVEELLKLYDTLTGFLKD